MCREAWKDKTSPESKEAAPRTYHRLSRCQVVCCLFTTVSTATVTTVTFTTVTIFWGGFVKI